MDVDDLLEAQALQAQAARAISRRANRRIAHLPPEERAGLSAEVDQALDVLTALEPVLRAEATQASASSTARAVSSLVAGYRVVGGRAVPPRNLSREHEQFRQFEADNEAARRVAEQEPPLDADALALVLAFLAKLIEQAERRTASDIVGSGITGNTCPFCRLPSYNWSKDPALPSAAVASRVGSETWPRVPMYEHHVTCIGYQAWVLRNWLTHSSLLPSLDPAAPF